MKDTFATATTTGEGVQGGGGGGNVIPRIDLSVMKKVRGGGGGSEKPSHESCELMGLCECPVMQSGAAWRFICLYKYTL